MTKKVTASFNEFNKFKPTDKVVKEMKAAKKEPVKKKPETTNKDNF